MGVVWGGVRLKTFSKAPQARENFFVRLSPILRCRSSALIFQSTTTLLRPIVCDVLPTSMQGCSQPATRNVCASSCSPIARESLDNSATETFVGSRVHRCGGQGRGGEKTANHVSSKTAQNRYQGHRLEFEAWSLATGLCTRWNSFLAIRH